MAAESNVCGLCVYRSTDILVFMQLFTEFFTENSIKVLHTQMYK